MKSEYQLGSTTTEANGMLTALLSRAKEANRHTKKQMRRIHLQKAAFCPHTGEPL